MKKLQGFKDKRLSGQVEWALRHDRRVVFHRLECLGEVKTPDGPMLLVRIRHKTDLSDPTVDVAALVGRAIVHFDDGKEDLESPDLWFWADRFWVKAKASDGTDYYRNKCYLLYEVQVRDPERLMHEVVIDP